MDDLCFDDRPWSVEVCTGAAGWRQAEFWRKSARGTEGYQRTSGFDKLLKLGHSKPTHSSGDIVRRSVISEKFEPLCFPVCQWLLFLWDVEHQRFCCSLARNQNQIVVACEVPLEYTLLKDQIIVHADAEGDFEQTDSAHGVHVEQVNLQEQPQPTFDCTMLSLHVHRQWLFHRTY